MAYPVMHSVYTAREVYELELLDSPFLRFCVGGSMAVIQTTHLTEEQLLSVPGFADTRWRYQRTTHEWIPLFMAVSDTEVYACVDIELGPDEPWVTPKGFPRDQYS